MKWFRWLLPSLVLVVTLTPALAQTAPRKKHAPADPVAAAQTAMLCNSLVFKFVLTPTEKQLVMSSMTPDEQGRFNQNLHLTDYTLSLSKMTKRKRNQYLASLPDENRNLSLQLLAALPAAQACAEAKAPATTTTGTGGTSNPPPNPSCTTSSTVDTTCPCNSLTVQDTRTDPTTGAKCCCNAATNACSSDSSCSAPVEWMFLAGAGLLLGGRYLRRWRRGPAA